MSSPKRIHFHDTKTNSVRLFEPVHDNEARIYSCGPTVYNYAHIGNFRNFVFVDVLRRVLKLFGYKVVHVRNITDIDDKIIRGAAEEKISTTELAGRYETAFFEDCAYLNLEEVEHSPRATENIDEMIELVQSLIDKGFTYERDGSIYFSINRFKDYGKLSKIDLTNVKSGARVDADEYSKEDARDFVLWKGRRGDEPYWDTPFGQGRPGWHIECSAMSRRFLGNTLDIHTGAEDLVFPHHENEIAQSEAANDQEYVRFWLHCAFLNMKDQKMSKSLGNIITAKKLRDEGVDGAAVRYFLLSVHYRKPLGFAMDAIEAAGTAVNRLRSFYKRVEEYGNDDSYNGTAPADWIVAAREGFMDALADDLNTAKALGVLFELVRSANAAMDNHSMTPSDAVAVLHFLGEADSVLGVIIVDKEDEMLSGDIEAMIEQRQAARKAKNFAEADRIRDELLEKGIVLEDTREGVRWRKI